MKKFSKFLVENIEELEGGFRGPETFIHVNENGDVVADEDEKKEDGIDPDEFSEFFSGSGESDS